MRVRATEGECRPGERAGRVPCGPDHPSGEGKGHRGTVARPGERAGRVPPAYGPCEPESREGYTPGRGPPYARVVTLTLFLSCVSPCVAASPGRVLAGVYAPGYISLRVYRS